MNKPKSPLSDVLTAPVGSATILAFFTCMKLKTHKALSKRVRVTKTGKVTKRKAGQNHFNGRESGKTTRNKRRDITMSSSHMKAYRTLLNF